jgi:tRNA(Ile2) C34 agmatinyltransferase TiaS|tara:strand:+ start:244 stop:450 length:207 start_codon:yes stop_codon:yes gene_type:complete
VRWVTEIVNGVCPDCAKESILISVDQFFKCTRCGTELEQKVNGKISYIPTGARPEDIRMVLKNNGEEI